MTVIKRIYKGLNRPKKIVTKETGNTAKVVKNSRNVKGRVILQDLRDTVKGRSQTPNP